MEIRKSPLPPDLQYCIDGGVEHGHITGGAHAAISLFGDIAELDRVHAIPHPGLRGWDATAAMCAEVEAYGQNLICLIDEPDLRAACLGSTTTSFLRALSQYGEFICWQSYEDAIWGGSMERRHNTMANWKGRIHPRLARRLRTNRWVKRAVRRHHGENGFEHLRHLKRIVGNPLPPANEDGLKLLALTLRDQRGRSVERSRQWVLDHTPTIKRENRQARAKGRRSIIRAATLASAVLGASAVSAFARGEAVRLPTDDLVLEVMLGGFIDRIGHSALHVEVKQPDGEYLAGLCVYQELPALDQLASLALHVQSGGIAEVIAAGNVYNPSPVAFQHPALSAKKPPPEVFDRLLVNGTVVFPIDDHAARQSLMRGYEDEMGDRFRHRTFIDVLGSREGASAWRTFVSFRERTPM